MGVGNGRWRGSPGRPRLMVRPETEGQRNAWLGGSRVRTPGCGGAFAGAEKGLGRGSGSLVTH